MIRRARLEDMPEVIEGFRMRGTEVSRMEAFADCVFGFGLTLLVVQLKVPRRFDELWLTMRGFIAFSFCFAIFFGVWSQHYTYCRRYGLQDARVRVLTAILLFVLLAYLYPLKFLSVVFVTFILNINIGWQPAPGDRVDMPLLFIIYGVGYAAIHGIFALLYWHAYQQRDKLKLDELEVLDTREWGRLNLYLMVVPIASVLIAAFGGSSYVVFAGYIYFLLGIVGFTHGMIHNRLHRAVHQRMEAAGIVDEDAGTTENTMQFGDARSASE